MKSINTVTLVLDLLSNFEDGLSISEISKRLEIPLGTSHRFLKSMVENGLIVQDQRTKLYKLGLKILTLATGMLHSNRLIKVAKDPMKKAAEKLKNVVYLSLEQNGEVVCVSSVNPTEDVKTTFFAQIGTCMPLHAAAAAKVIFAHYPSKILKDLISKKAPLKSYTPRTRITEQAILKDYLEITKRGFAVCDEELEEGVIAIAAPVFNYDDSVIASVAVTGIKANVSEPLLIETILNCGNQISTLMGYSTNSGKMGLSK